LRKKGFARLGGLCVWQALEEQALVCVGIYAVGFTRFDDAIERGAALGPARRSGKQPVFTADRKRANRILDPVVVRTQATVLKVRKDTIPLITRVAHGYPEQALGRRPQGRCVEQHLDLPEYRADLGLARLILQRIHFADMVQHCRGCSRFRVLAGNLEHVEELSTHMRQATDMANVFLLAQRLVPQVAVRLQIALKVADERLCYFAAAAGCHRAPL